MVVVYKIFDVMDRKYLWYGDQDDIINWLLDSQAEQLDFTEEDLKEKGWIWGLEKTGLTYEEIYNKD